MSSSNNIAPKTVNPNILIGLLTLNEKKFPQPKNSKTPAQINHPKTKDRR